MDYEKNKEALAIVKQILLSLTALAMVGCSNYTVNGIAMEEGDTKTYETKDYIIVYEFDGVNGFGQPFWKFKEIKNKNLQNVDSVVEQIK